MAFTDEQVMLTLAGLTYRGFHDPGRGEAHDTRVRDGVQAGLETLAPVRGEWELAWGPATSRELSEAIDTNAMFVVRHARDRHRYVVAIRGTNPISLPDWVFGDFWVNATVPWPYAPAATGAAVSASTVLGLNALYAMRARPLPASSGHGLSALVGHFIGRLTRSGATAAARLGGPVAELRAALRAQLSRPLQTLLDTVARSEGIEALIRKAATVPTPLPVMRRPRPAAGAGGDPDLLTFLGAAAAGASTALDVTVTGHSKGAALAQAVALWLRESLDVPDERWDDGRGARIHCHAFAGPTPGNAAFARRLAEALGTTHHHVRNMHDVVTHAWQADELGQVPALYGTRTAPFKPLVESIVGRVGPIGYAHVQPGVRRIEGPLVGSRGFPEEFIHQHLDAYLHALGLDAHGIDGLTLFVG
jgi:hypothetical protein